MTTSTKRMMMMMMIFIILQHGDFHRALCTLPRHRNGVDKVWDVNCCNFPNAMYKCSGKQQTEQQRKRPTQISWDCMWKRTIMPPWPCMKHKVFKNENHARGDPDLDPCGTWHVHPPPSPMQTTTTRATTRTMTQKVTRITTATTIQVQPQPHHHHPCRRRHQHHHHHIHGSWLNDAVRNPPPWKLVIFIYVKEGEMGTIRDPTTTKER